MANGLLPKFELEEKNLKKIATAKGMEKLFDKLKEKGLFKNFGSYKEWCESKEILKDKKKNPPKNPKHNLEIKR